MASSEQTFNIIFGAIDKVGPVAQRIEKRVTGIGDKAQKLAQPFQASATAILGAQAAVLGLSGAVIALASDAQASQAKIQAAFGVPAEEAKQFADVAKAVYVDGLAASVQEGTDKVISAFRVLGDVGEEELEKITVFAGRLESTFGADFEKTVQASKTLVENFGLSSEEAFDLITAGYQRGLDSSGDFLDTINEYSTQFKDTGANAGEFFSILETGLGAGVLGTDKVADSFKEFNLRILDGSKSTKEGLAAIGISQEDLTQQINSGQTSISETFGQVVTRLGELDEATRRQEGVKLLGTQFEDLGFTAGAAIDTTVTKLEDLQGAADSLDIQNATKSFQEFARTVRTEFGDLPVFDQLSQEASAFFADLTEKFPKALEGVDFDDLVQSFRGAGAEAVDALENLLGGVDLSTTEGITEAIQLIVDNFEALTDTTKGLIEGFQPLFELIGEGAKFIQGLDSETLELVGNIVSLGVQIGVAGGALKLFDSAVGGVGTGITSLSGVATKLPGKLKSVAGGISGITGLLGKNKGLTGIALGVGVAIGTWLNKFKVVQDAAQAVIGIFDDLFNITDSPSKKELAEIDKNFQAAREKAKELQAAIQKSDESAKTLNETTKQTPEEIEKAKGKVSELNEEVGKVGVAFAEGTGSVKEAYDKLVAEAEAAAKEAAARIAAQDKVLIRLGIDPSEASKEFRDFAQREVEAKQYLMSIQVDPDDIEEAKDDLDSIAPDKKYEIDADLELGRLKEQSKRAEDLLQFQASIETAKFDADARKLESSFQAIEGFAESTGEVISSALGILARDDLDFFAEKKIEAQLQKENEFRAQQLKLQEELTRAQVQYLNTRRERIEQTEEIALNVKAEGLKPHLELIWFDVIEELQVNVSEQFAEAVLGLVEST